MLPLVSFRIDKISLFLLTLFCSAFFYFSAFAQKNPVKNVAVIETGIDEHSGVVNEISKAEVRIITNEIRRQAVNNLPRGRFNVMTSETVMSMGDAVLEDCAEENCVIALGSKIGADFIVRGIISKFREIYTLSVEMYETEYGMLVATAAPVRTENIRELLEKSTDVCKAMYKEFAETSAGTTGTAARTPHQSASYTPAPAAPANPASAGNRDTPSKQENDGDKDKGKRNSFYFTPKWNIVGPSKNPGLVTLNLEAGSYYNKYGNFWGVDVGASHFRDESFALGATLNLGKDLNVGGNNSSLQLVYGASFGVWRFKEKTTTQYLYYNIDKTQYGIIGLFGGLRVYNIELLYRGLISPDYLFNQIMLGYRFRSSKK